MFLSQRKATSPALRQEVRISTDVFKRFKNKKFLPSRAHRHFESKKTKRKVGLSPSIKQYKLFRHYIYRTIDTKISSLHRNPYLPYFTACVEANGIRYYIKAAHGMAIGTSVSQYRYALSHDTPFKLGDRLDLRSLPTGSLCYSLEMPKINKWRIAEAAGTYCKIMWHDDDLDHTALYIPSKKMLKVNYESMSNVGRVSNYYQNNTVLGNARGTRKKKKKAISVRGIAMNPIDHPNGGRANTRRPMKNPWYKVAKRGK